MKKIYLWIMMLGLTLAAPAKAELQIDVSGGVSNPLPIAFPEMIAANSEAEDYGEQIREVVIAIHKRSPSL